MDSWKEQRIKTRSNLLGFHWLVGFKAWDFLLIREDGFDLYKVDLRDIKAKRVKDFGENIGHYWLLYEPFTLVIAESPPKLGQMQVYFLTEKVTKGCKLLIDVSPSITNQWTSTPYLSRDLYSEDRLDPAPHEVRISQIYAKTHLVHLHCLKGFVSVFTIETANSQAISEVLRISPGAYDISLADNVLLLHNITDQSSYLYDIKAEEKQRPSCLVWHNIPKSPITLSFRVYIDRSQSDYFPELQIKYNGKVIPNLRDFRGFLDVSKAENLIECIWSLNTKLIKVTQDVYVDLENCCYCRIGLNWREIAANWGNREECVRFLMRRKGVLREEIVNYCLDLLGNRLVIEQIGGLFKALLTEETLQMSQNELHTLLFRRLFLCPSLDSAYITSSLFCFFQLVTDLNQPLNGNIQFAVAQFLLRTRQFPLLLHAFICGVFDDSQEIAVMLTTSDLSAVFIEGLDMMYRLGLVEDLSQLLYERKMYVEMGNLLAMQGISRDYQRVIGEFAALIPDITLGDALKGLLISEEMPISEA